MNNIKTTQFACALVAVIFALALGDPTSANSQTVTVETHVRIGSITGPIDPDDIYICTDDVYLVTTIRKTGSGSSGTYSVTQKFPPNCTIILVQQTGATAILQILADNSLKYLIGDNGGDLETIVTLRLIIPCDVPKEITDLGTYRISYSDPTPGYTLTAEPKPLRLIRAKMLITGFADDAPPPTGLCDFKLNKARKLLVGLNQHRYFNLMLTEGRVNGFTFVYEPEFEIKPYYNGSQFAGLTFAKLVNGVISPTPIPQPQPTIAGNSYSFIFTPQMIEALFPVAQFPDGMTYNDGLHVTESFDVISCSVPFAKDSTRLTLTWDCREHPAVDHGCNSVKVEPSILVEAFKGDITPSIHFERPSPDNGTPGKLEFCFDEPTDKPTDIIVSFRNSTYGKSESLSGSCLSCLPQFNPGDDYIPGSAIKTLHTNTFHMKQNVFSSLGSLLLEGSVVNPLFGFVFAEKDNVILKGKGTAFTALLPGDIIYWTDAKPIGKVSSVLNDTELMLDQTFLLPAAKMSGPYGKLTIVASVAVSALNHYANLDPRNFYNYDSSTHLVTLNFDVLSALYQGAGNEQPLGPDGPLVNGFIPEAGANPIIFNEMKEGAVISLRFKNAVFNCADALFYPNLKHPQGFEFSDRIKPEVGYMFFGNAGDTFDFQYDDMCQQTPLLIPVTLTRSGITATFMTEIPHGLAGVETVTVKGASETAYNGTFSIALTADPTKFTYTMSSTPDADAAVATVRAYVVQHPPLTDQKTDYGNFHYEFPVTVDAKAECLNCPGGQDLELDDTALLQFQYTYNGTDTAPSPFAFKANGAPAGLYFDCVNTYQLKLTIPALYCLYDPVIGSESCVDKITYFPNISLNEDANPQKLQKKAVFDYTQDNIQYKCYIFDLPSGQTDEPYKGHIAANVKLTNCPSGGGLDTFTAEIQAICNDCVQCSNTVATIQAYLQHHCLDNCSGSTAPQNTTSFSFKRKTFGTVENSTAPVIDTTPGITTDRFYPCDEVEFVATGIIANNNPLIEIKELGFRIDYQSDTGFQFFEWEPNGSGTLEFGAAGSSLVLPGDLGSEFLGAGGWPANSVVPAHFNLFVNFNVQNNPLLKSAINGGQEVSLTFRMRVRIKQAVPAGKFPLLLTGGFWARTKHETGGIKDEESCDPYIATLKVLGVTTTSYAEFLPYGNEGVCTRRFKFGTVTEGGLPGFREFESPEFRPIVELRNLITLGATINGTAKPLPEGVDFQDARLYYFNPETGQPLDYPVHLSFLSDNMVTFDGYTDGTTRAWPLLARYGPSTDLRIEGSVRNDCPPTASLDTVYLDWEYTDYFYSPPSPFTCQEPKHEPRELTYHHLATEPEIKLAPPKDCYEIDTTFFPPMAPGFVGVIDSVKFTYVKPEGSIENAWIRVISSGPNALEVGFIQVNNDATFRIPINGYFQVGNIATGVQSPAHIKLFVTAFNDCEPGAEIPVTIEGGYHCARYPAVYPPAPTEICSSASCEFKVKLLNSDMFIRTTDPSPTVCPIENLCGATNKVTLKSSDRAFVVEPMFLVTLPAGVKYDPSTRPATAWRNGNVPLGVVIFDPPGLQVGPKTLTWNIKNKYAPAGFPPFPECLELWFPWTASCGSHTVTFTATGKDLCNQPLPEVEVYSYTLETTGVTAPGWITPIGSLDKTLDCVQTAAINTAMALKPTATNSCDDNLPIHLVSMTHIDDPDCTNGFLQQWVRVWDFDDDCGYDTLPFTQTITVTDSTTTPPVITHCPPDRTIYPGPPPFECCIFMPDMRNEVVVSDNCPLGLVRKQNPEAGTHVCPGQYTVVFTVSDCSNRSDTCSMVVTVDSLSRLICSDIIAECTSPDGALVTYPTPSANAACCPPMTTPVCTPPSGSQFSIGVKTVICTASDACGFTRTCTFTVAVKGVGNDVIGQWARSDGGDGSQLALALAVDGAGNSYVAGTYEHAALFEGEPLTSAGNKDVLLARYGGAGNLLWVRSAGGMGDDEAQGVAVDSQGNVYVTGLFHSTATFPGVTPITITAAGGSDVFLAMYDAQGVCLWAVAAGGAGNDSGAGVAVDAADNCYVTGTFVSSATFNSTLLSGGGTPVVAGSGSTDCFLAKYDASGAALWVDASGGFPGHSARTRGLAVDANGNAWIVGIFEGFVAFDSQAVFANPGRAFAFVARHGNTAGDWVWAKQTLCGGVCGSHDGRAIGVDAAGNCYFTAYYSGDAQIGAPALPVTNPNGLALYDCLVGSFSPTGVPRWLRNGLSSSLNDQEPRGLAVDPDGNVYVTGFLNGSGITAAAGRDVWLRKYDALGKFQWVESGIGTVNQFNSGQAVTLDRAGCVYVTGSFADTAPLVFSGFANGGALTAADAREDIFLVKYCPTCCAPPPPDLVSWYPMDGTTADYLKLNNPSAFFDVTFVAGRVNEGVSFGPAGRIVVPDSPSLANGIFTLDAWVKPVSSAVNIPAVPGRAIIVKGSGPATDTVGLYYAQQGGKFYVTFGSRTSPAVVSTGSFPPGQYYFVATTFDGSILKLFVNGDFQGVATPSVGQAYNSTAWTIGAHSPPDLASRTWTGVIDEVEIFNRALEPEEIQKLFEMGSGGKCKGPCWPPATLIALTLAGSGITTITWNGPGVLQCASAPTGPWSEVIGATSPYTVTSSADSPKKFFRVFCE